MMQKNIRKALETDESLNANTSVIDDGGDTVNIPALSPRPMAEPGAGRLPYLAFGRVTDQVVLASLCTMQEEKEKIEGMFKRLLEASRQKLASGQRQRLQWNSGSVCCLLDSQGICLYSLVTESVDYPERLACLAAAGWNRLHGSTAELDNAAQAFLIPNFLRIPSRYFVAAVSHYMFRNAVSTLLI